MPNEEGWLEFGFERFDEVEGLLARLRTAGLRLPKCTWANRTSNGSSSA